MTLGNGRKRLRLQLPSLLYEKDQKVFHIQWTPANRNNAKNATPFLFLRVADKALRGDGITTGNEV